MAIPNWLPIAISNSSVIATLTAPLVPGFVASRKNQPRPTSEGNQPKKRIQIIGSWLRRALGSPWVLQPLGVVINIFVLRYEFRHATPITGEVIFAISFTTGSIFFNLALLFIVDLTRQIGRILDVIHNLSDNDSGILEITRGFHDRVKKLEEKPKTKKLPKG
jgi:hypothetical protein